MDTAQVVMGIFLIDLIVKPAQELISLIILAPRGGLEWFGYLGGNDSKKMVK